VVPLIRLQSSQNENEDEYLISSEVSMAKEEEIRKRPTSAAPLA
jgi:hypothetical protein